ncbi:type I restriction enzyme HsdR N-terminal domain-containing protein [Enterococcus hirae]
MNISTFVKQLTLESIVSEQDTRTKVAIPLLDALGYPSEFMANEFPIYGFEGRKPLYPKPIDIILFSSSGFEKNRKREERDWVMAHSLLAVELKKPSESIEDAQGQAQFYSHWSRCPYYMCTNGVEIAIYKLSANTADEIICKCNIRELPKNWVQIYSEISFSNVKSFKESYKENDRLIYAKYCESKLKTNHDNFWNWEQEIIRCQDGAISTSSDIKKTFDSDRLVTLLAGAGFGKTNTILRLYNEFLHQYLSLQNQAIPIFLYAKYWKKTFNSVEEGILNELASFVGGITLDVIKNDLIEKKYIIFIDGLDECVDHREILLQSINKLSEIDSIQIMTSCRKEQYHKELRYFSAYELKGLSEGNMVSIGSEVLNQHVTTLIYTLGNNLKETLKVPLFFSMWLNFCLDKGKPTVPKNQAMLYEHFITRSIIDESIKKGNYDGNLLPIELLKSTLSKFSYSSTVEQSKVTLPEIMSITPLIKEKMDSSLTILLQSGLIFNFDGIIDFRQHSMKEYFCALEIAKKTEEEIFRFIELNHDKPIYKETILHLLGIMDNEKIQEDILDFLEVNNLPLYIHCLKRRFNFSSSQFQNLNKVNSQKFLSQIAKTYEKVIDSCFPMLKKYLAPWKEIDDNASKVFILKGNLDLKTLDLNILLDSGAIQDSNIIFTFNSSKPEMFIEREGKSIPIPIVSFTNNYNSFYYNVNELHEGIDCAREIAINMIKKGIENIFKSKPMLFDEPPYMQLSYVEKSLKKLPIGYKDKKTMRLRQFSLANESIDELLDFFTHILNLEQYESKNREFNALITGGVLYGLKNLNLDSDFILPPKIDRPIISGHVSNLYTVNSIKNWIRKTIIVRQESYRLFIEIFLSNIKHYIPEYVSGPYKYDVILTGVDIMQNKFTEYAGISLYPFPVEANFVEVNVRSIDGKNEDSNYEKRTASVMEEYQRLRRPSKFYTESSSSLWYEIREDNSLREWIYAKILKDVINLLEGK